MYKHLYLCNFLTFLLASQRGREWIKDKMTHNRVVDNINLHQNNRSMVVYIYTFIIRLTGPILLELVDFKAGRQTCTWNTGS